MKSRSNFIKSIGFILIVILLIACKDSKISNSNNLVNTDSAKENETLYPKLKFETLPDNKTEFKLGETVVIKIIKVDSIAFDSIQFFVENKYLKSTIELPLQIQLKSEEKKPRQSDFEARIFIHGKSISQNISLRYFSDIIPKIYTYQVVKSFPHDRNAYTQGLVYEDGYLYESNGLKSESTLRKLQIGTGEIIQSYTLAPEIFAEGITIMGDKIIQLSWQNQIGFVYDKKTFNLLSKFSYTTEGWGLANDGKNLIMTDGSNNVYFIDPRTFTEVSRIEVYDDKGQVDQLNELEYINGEIYANIYTTDKIVRIDPLSGKVLSYIDLSNLLNKNEIETETNVLNGIAYDTAGKRLFVTGKKWPKLFEIKLKEKIK